MARNDEVFEQRRCHEASKAARDRADVASPDRDEDWPLLSALLGGLAVALLFNTFLGLIPG